MSLLSLSGSLLRKLCLRVLLNEEKNDPQSSLLSVKSECLSNAMHFCNEKWLNILYLQTTSTDRKDNILNLPNPSPFCSSWSSSSFWQTDFFFFFSAFAKGKISILMKGLTVCFLVIHLSLSWISSRCVRKGLPRALTTISKMMRTLQEEYEILINLAAFANQFLCFTPGSWCEPGVSQLPFSHSGTLDILSLLFSPPS